MRIGKTTISSVALYADGLWGLSISYRVIFIAWRMVELGFIAMRYLFIRAPILLLWTRLPVTKNITLPGPYRILQDILDPVREAKLVIAGGRTGQMPFLDAYQSPEDVKKQQEFLRSVVTPPSAFKVAMGGLIRGLVTELGSVFIKFSQIMSMRPELPPFIREELTRVQDRMPGLPEAEVRSTLEKELMKPVEEIFEWVDYKPVAAASLAVVHHAKLRDGREVALKIQRPFLQGIVALDTVILLKILLGALKVLPQIRKTDLTFFTLSFEGCIRREIDFDLEGHVQERCWEAMHASQQSADFMVIAEVYLEYTSKKLLTMEFVPDLMRIDELFEKCTPDELWALLTTQIPGFDKELPVHVLLLGCRFPMHLAWQGEVFHGDLHMGNIYFIKPKFEGDHWRYFLCDFGMYERVSREEWRAMMVLLWGILGGMPEMAVEGMKSVHVMSGGKLRDVDWDKLLSAFSDFSSSWIEVAPEEESGIRLRRSKLNEGGLTRQLAILLMNQVIASGLRLPYWIWLVLKSYLYLEETGTAIMGGSYDWMAWIFDQYTVRVEKDAVLALFDRTNVFTMDRAIDTLQYPLARGQDYPKVMRALMDLHNEIESERPKATR